MLWCNGFCQAEEIPLRKITFHDLALLWMEDLGNTSAGAFPVAGAGMSPHP